MGLAVSTRGDGTSTGKVSIGPHAAAGRHKYIVDEMAGSAIHRHTFKGPRGDRGPRRNRFHRIHDWIAGIRIVDVATCVEKGLEALCKPGLQKQPFADRLLGPGSSSSGWRSSIATASRATL